MNFLHASGYLTKIFEENSFAARVAANDIHSCLVPIQSLANDSKIHISFPGYKAKQTRWGMTYDYRVDLVKNGISTALSHANIITDIYNKITQGGMCPLRLKEVLIEVTQEGDIKLDAISAALTYSPTDPSPTLIERVAVAHNGKTFNRTGNSFDLTLEELLASIKWIVLQEDINYPIARGLEGRKMPLARYIETILITQDSTHSLEEVIARALSHTRPARWADMDYSFLELIK